MRADDQFIALAKGEHSVDGITHAAGVSDDGIENRLRVGRRAGDDLQDLGCRRLLV